MEDKQFIFLAGLHRSGTSLLHEVMRNHPEITGFSNTGVPEDEGQHLQSVYEPALAYGGPGKFIFDKRSHMDESHPLATAENAALIFEEWRKYLDPSCQTIIEKSPPNIVRMRFFQKLFPGSKFIAILRHPLVVSYATIKWAKTSISSLLDHALLGYEAMLKDMSSINSLYVLRYEDFVIEPQQTIDKVFAHLGMESVEVTHQVRTDINDKYFAMWEQDQNHLLKKWFNRIPDEYEQRANRCGYSISNYRKLVPAPWLGAHLKAPR